MRERPLRVTYLLTLFQDHQFGPVVLLGIGGTGVEIYRDTALRMVPLRPQDVTSMVKGLKGHRLLEGYRTYAAKIKHNLH